MKLRASASMYWPGMTTDIDKRRQECQSCHETAPSQASEPPITPDVPQYPFQHVCSDYFEYAGHNFCLIVDRFSNWLQVFHGKGGSSNLISLLGQMCHNFGIPESISTDGGPQYMSSEFAQFLKCLGIKHRLSSVAFPHSNQKAEKSVGTAKRLIRDAVKMTGEFNSVLLIKGLLCQNQIQ